MLQRWHMLKSQLFKRLQKWFYIACESRGRIGEMGINFGRRE
jgi:hypothetical protein